MKIRELMYEMLLGEAISKKILDQIKKKWSKSNPEVTDDTVEFAVNNFYTGFKGSDQLKDKIKQGGLEKSPIIKGFLARHDGLDSNGSPIPGAKPFKSSQLLDLQQYSWNQAVDLFGEFDIELGAMAEPEADWVHQWLDNSGFAKKSDEEISASKDLWFGDREKIYDDGEGFRVYSPKSQKHAIAFGLYNEYLSRKIGGSPWCIATRSTSSTYYNMYRDRGLTYYFVINENYPIDNYNYLSVIMPSTKSTDFEYTNLNNGGGNTRGVDFSSDEFDKCLTCMHPQIENSEELRSLFATNVPYDRNSELNLSNGEQDPVSLIVENINSRWDFSRQRRSLKKARIATGDYLLEVRSFQSMTTDMILSYIKLTNSDNWGDKFQTMEIVEFFKNNKDYKEKLRRHLSGEEDPDNGAVIVGNKLSGKQDVIEDRPVIIADLATLLLKNKYKPAMGSKTSATTEIKQNTEDGRYGIWDGQEGEWLTHNDIKYTPDYREESSSEWPKMGSFTHDDSEDIDNPEQDDQPQQEPSNDVDTDQVDNDQVDNDQVDNDQVDNGLSYPARTRDERFDDELGDIENLNEQEEDGNHECIITKYSREDTAGDSDSFYTIHTLESVSGTAHVVIMSHQSWEGTGKNEFIDDEDKDPSEVRQYLSDLTKKFKGKMSE